MVNTIDRKPVAAEHRAAHGAVVGIVGLLLGLAQSVVQVPLLLNFWSSQNYGLWAAITASSALLTALDAGHQNYLGNEFNRLWVSGAAEIRQVVASGFRCAFCIAAFELMLALGVCYNREAGLLLFGDIDPSATPQIASAVLVYIVFWGLNGSVGGILVRLYPPAGLYAWGQWLGIASRLTGFAALVCAVASGASLLGVMFAQVAAYSAFNLFLFSDLRRRIPGVYPWWQGGDWKTAWSNFRASIVLTFNSIIDQVANNGLVLILVHAVNPVGIAVFTTLRTVANTATQGSTVIMQPIVPDAVRYYVNREPTKLAAVFSVGWMVGNSLVCAGFLLGLPVVEFLYMQWTRHRLPFDRVLFVMLVFAVAARQWAAPAQTLLVGLNSLREQTVLVLLRVFITLVLILVLLNRFGLAAAGVGLAAGETSGAIAAIIFARLVLRKISGSLPCRALWLSIAQLALLAAGLLCFVLSENHGALPWIILSAIGVLILAVWQWIELPRGVQSRLGMVMPRINRFGARFA